MAQGGFQRNIPGADPATYTRQGVVEQADTSLAPLIEGADMIGGAVKQGYGTGLGERIMNETLDEFLGQTAAQGGEGVTQSIGMETGQVNQFGADGEPLGVSGTIDPALTGEARTRAIQESTRGFNQKASKLKRAYERGAIDDRELRARMSLNLREAEETYPAFKEEINQQARRMLTDDLYYYHYTSAVSGIEAQRKQRESEAQQAAKQQQEMNEMVAKEAFDMFGIHPSVAMQDMDSTLRAIQKQRQLGLEDEQLERMGARDKATERQATQRANLSGTIYADMAFKGAQSSVMDSLGIDEPSDITQGLGAINDSERATLVDRLNAEKMDRVREYQSENPRAKQDEVKRMIARIEGPYDEMIESVKEPEMYDMVARGNEYTDQLNYRDLDLPAKRLALLGEKIFQYMDETSKMNLMYQVNKGDQSKRFASYIAGKPYEPGGEDDITPEDTGAGEEVFSGAARELSRVWEAGEQDTTMGKETESLARDVFSNNVRATSHHLDLGDGRAFDNVLKNAETIISTARRNPEMMKSLDEESKNIAQNNIQRLITSAQTGINEWLSEDQLSGIYVDPNTGTIKMTGEYDSPARTMGTIAPDKGKAFLNNINMAVKAQAALSGDMSLSNRRQVANAVAERFKLSGPNPDETQIRSHVAQVAEGLGIDPEFATALVKQESAFNPQAVSDKGAAGLMQIMPETGRELGLTVDDNRDDRTNPVKAIPAGLSYLKKNMDSAKSLDPQIKEREQRAVALAMYNAGPGVTRQYLTGESDALETGGSYEEGTGYGETRRYIDEILGGKGTWKLLKNVRNRLVYSEENDND